MRNKKFNLTGYQPFRSSELPSPPNLLDNKFKSRYSPHKSAFLKRDLGSKSKQTQIQILLTSKQGVFSLEKLSFEKKRQQKELIQSAKLPNFSIKRFFQRSANKKCNEPLQETSSSFSSSSKRQSSIQPALKRHWERYLNQEITYADLTKELNKNIIDVTQRQKKNETSMSYSAAITQEDHKRIQKSAFYINNFIKTTYRKRRIEHKVQLEKEEPVKQVKIIEETVKQKPQKPRDDDFGNQKSWSMVPWQKFNDAYDEEQFGPL